MTRPLNLPEDEFEAKAETFLVSNRWRLLEINCGLPMGRFLAVQVEGGKPEYDPEWRRLEPLAEEEGFAGMEPNSIGDRHGRWREEPLP